MAAVIRETRSQDPAPFGVVAYAVSLIRRHAGASPPRLSDAARAHLQTHFWAPGYAGLEACIQRAIVLCDGQVIEPRHLPLDAGAVIEYERCEQRTILSNLEAAHGARREAAARLGIAPRTLRLKLADLRARGVFVPPPSQPRPLEFCDE